MSMATTTKKKASSKVKAEEPAVVLRTPSTPSAIHTVTPLELFRLMISEKPHIGMVMEGGTPLLAWDKTGKPSTYNIGSSAQRGNMSFIDYLTEDEGIEIPGSAKERIEPSADDPEIPVLIPPTPLSDVQQIHDGVPFVVQYHNEKYYTYDALIARNGKGRRYLLLIQQNNQTKTHDNSLEQNHGYRKFMSFLPMEAAAKFADHPMHKHYA